MRSEQQDSPEFNQLERKRNEKQALLVFFAEFGSSPQACFEIGPLPTIARRAGCGQYRDLFATRRLTSAREDTLNEYGSKQKRWVASYI